MKYHYKSPRQIRGEAEETRRSGPAATKRNRSTMILLADLAIILLIFGVLYYSGIWPLREFTSQETWRRGPFEFSATLRLEGAARNRLAFYLNVKNDSTTPRDFPAPGFAGVPSPASAEGEIGEARLLAASVKGERFTARMQVPSRTIQPGETTIYREELQMPAGQALAEGSGARLELETPDEPVRIDLP